MEAVACIVLWMGLSASAGGEQRTSPPPCPCAASHRTLCKADSLLAEIWHPQAQVLPTQEDPSREQAGPRRRLRLLPYTPGVRSCDAGCPTARAYRCHRARDPREAPEACKAGMRGRSAVVRCIRFVRFVRCVRCRSGERRARTSHSARSRRRTAWSSAVVLVMPDLEANVSSGCSARRLRTASCCPAHATRSDVTPPQASSWTDMCAT